MRRLPLAIGLVLGLLVFAGVMTWFMLGAANAELGWVYEECHESNYGFEEECTELHNPHRESRAGKFIEYAGGGVLWGAIGGFFSASIASATSSALLSRIRKEH